MLNGDYSVRVPYVLVDVVLSLHVSLTTKITVTLFVYHYSPLAAEQSGGTIDRVTTNSPYNKARCSGASLYSQIKLWTE